MEQHVIACNLRYVTLGLAMERWACVTELLDMQADPRVLVDTEVRNLLERHFHSSEQRFVTAVSLREAMGIDRRRVGRTRRLAAALSWVFAGRDIRGLISKMLQAIQGAGNRWAS